MPKQYEIATLDEAIDALNQGATLHLADIRPSLRSAWVHVGYHGLGGGYLPDDSSHFYARSRRAIVDAHCDTCRDFDDSARVPDHFRRDLLRGAAAYSKDGRTCFESDCVTLRELCSAY